jgi:SAM-dependent methyltransferase
MSYACASRAVRAHSARVRGRSRVSPSSLPRGLLAAILLVLASAPLVDAQRARHGRLFPPEELGTLEGPDRDAWQQPGRIMDALGIGEASVVADLGAGGGWFTIRLARRVGPNGIVYAEDVQRQMIDAIERRVQREGLNNVRTVLGLGDDPRLRSGSVDAALMVDAYHEVEVEDRVEFLAKVRSALPPRGRLGIVGFRRDGLGPGPPLEDRVDPPTVIGDAQAAGLLLVSHEDFLPFEYLLIFSR